MLIYHLSIKNGDFHWFSIGMSRLLVYRRVIQQHPREKNRVLGLQIGNETKLESDLPRDAGTLHFSHFHFSSSESTASCTVTTPLWNRITKRTYHTISKYNIYIYICMYIYMYVYYIYNTYIYVAIHHQSVIPDLRSLVYSRMASETLHISCFTSVHGRALPFAHWAPPKKIGMSNKELKCDVCW